MAELNKQQREAVELEADKILCLAGAGTGKTFSMIQRIARLVDQELVHPLTILVLTFTNAAAFEMNERYKNLNISHVSPEFRTFHSFCYSILAKDKEVRSALGYTDVPSIASPEELMRICNSTKLQCNIRLSDKKLSNRDLLSAKEQYEYDLYHKALKRSLGRSNLITFDILCKDVCGLFTGNHPSIQKYRDRYKYIFVDEFQDTDKTQFDFVSSFKHAKLFVVGDALQAIYSFRGADSSIIKQLANDKSWTTVKLYQNYRSTKEICDYANENSHYADSSYRIEISSEREGCDVVTTSGSHIDFNGPAVDANHMVDVVSRLADAEGTSAILCRTNAEASFVAEYLKTCNIDFRVGKKNETAQYILRCIYDTSYAVEWLSTFLDSNEYADYIRLSAIYEQEGCDNEFVFWNYFTNKPKVRAKAQAITTIRNILNSDWMPFQKCSGIFTTLGVRQIVDTTASTNAEILEYVKKVMDPSNDSKIYVGTIHSSKGLEYDNVFLMGVDDRRFYLNSEEMQNLFYVGVTRAKSHLYVYTA